MLGFIFRKAQDTVDNAIDSAIGSVINGIVIAVPFILAFAFAIAALAGWLHSMFEPVTANVLLALLFAVAGGVAMAIVHVRSAPDPIEEGADFGTRLPEEEVTGTRSAFSSSTDSDALMGAAAAAAPLIPTILPFVARNWTRIVPILLAIGVAAFVLLRMSRTPEETASAVPQMQPAE